MAADQMPIKRLIFFENAYVEKNENQYRQKCIVVVGAGGGDGGWYPVV